MIKKAIFPVGGLGTRFLPATKAMPKEMLPVVDKPLIQYAVEEAAEAGVEEFIFVTGRNKTAIEDHFDHSFELEETLAAKGKDEALHLVKDMLHNPGSVFYVRQQQPAGLGHAVWCARHLVGSEPVAVLLADDLVMDVPHEQTGSYGIVTPGADDGRIVQVEGLVEKPDPSSAPSNIAVVGRYIITPEVFETLAAQERGAGGEIQLTDALAKQIGKASFSGVRFSGERFDCGSKLGFLQANVAFGLNNDAMRDQLRDWLGERLG